MIIRHLMEADTQAVSDIEASVFSQPWTKEGFDEVVGREDTLFLVADEAGEIRGYIGSYIALDEAEITNVCTALEYRQMGVANRLMETFFTEARSRGVARIVLEVRASNEPAQKLYEKWSFSSIGIRKDFYSFPVEDAVIMERLL